MIKQFTSLLRRIVGRVKKNMETYLMLLVSLIIPLGFSMLALALYSTPTKWMLAVVSVLGIFLALGILRKVFNIVSTKEKENRNKEIENRGKIDELMELLRGISKDIRNLGDKHERNERDSKQ